jgi:hypothetical protein
MAVLHNLSQEYFAALREDADRVNDMGGYSFAAYHKQLDLIDTLEDFFLKQKSEKNKITRAWTF